MSISSAIQSQLMNTKNLFSTVHHFQCSPVALPGKSTRGAAITYSDLNERRSDFIRELRSTICGWVYSKSKFSKMLAEELALRGNDQSNATSQIVEMARLKFRRGYPQGQFGELLLFNFIEHFFGATPLLRKMPLVTNPSIERHGADAIHLGMDGNAPKIYLGEAKTYESKYKFNTALKDAIDSIVNSHSNLQSELDLYVHDDFIEHPLDEVALQIKRNQIPYTVELVSIVAYDENREIKVGDEAEIKKKIEEVIGNRIKNVPTAHFDSVNHSVVGRMHFFLLPFWDLTGLLEEFDR